MPDTEGFVMAIRLTTANVWTLPDGKHSDTKAPNLALWVRNGGTSRAWLWRYSRNTKAETISLGSLRRLGLDDARIKAFALKAVLDSGKDPKAAPVAKAVTTLRQDTMTYYDYAHREWSKLHASLWLASMENHVLETLGDRDTASLTAADVKAVIEPLWHCKTETAQRVLGRVRSVIDHAMLTDDHFRFPSNVADGVARRLPRGVRPPEVPHASMPYQEVPGFYCALAERSDIATLALRFLLDCCCPRASEITGATWSEIDGDVFRVPGVRMKSGKSRPIPLSAAALKTLSLIPRTSEFIFPGRRGKWVADKYIQFSGRMHKDGMIPVMRGLGITRDQCDVHGLRATFKTWGTEKRLDHDAIELALDHKIGGKVEDLYLRTNLMERRRELAEQWAAHLTGA
jgi:integrase